MITLSRFAPMAAAALAENPSDAGAPVRAHLNGSWLVMTEPSADAVTPRDLLVRNRALPGLLKSSLTQDGAMQFRADIPLDEEAEPLIRATRCAFESVLARARSVALEDVVARTVSQDDLRRLCDEAGWPSAPRGADSCVVELEVPGTFIQASIAPSGGGVRASVLLSGCDESSADSVSAIVTLLLAVGDSVRMARPFLESNDGRAIPGFEVTFSAVPTASQLAHALSALSVACQCCGEEIRALLDPDVAREFLALSKTTPRKDTTP